MFRRVLFKLTGIFLILYISASSATPTGQPGEAQNINVESDIHARAPSDDKCVYPYTWIRRECVGSRTAWQDVCGWSSYATGFQTVFDNKAGDCPANTYCLDGFDSDGRRIITCVPTAQAKGKQKLDSQAGSSEAKRARTQLSNSQVEYSVTIDHDMTGASVAAVLTSSDGSYLIAPNNVIVGNVHGRKQQVCSGDKSSPTKARECYPNGTYDFKTGQTIDFTWGMSSDQVGKLFYGILPGVPDD